MVFNSSENSALIISSQWYFIFLRIFSYYFMLMVFNNSENVVHFYASGIYKFCEFFSYYSMLMVFNSYDISIHITCIFYYQIR